MRPVAQDDLASVLKLWVRRHREVSRQRSNRLVCHLHAVLCDLIPGGFATEITVGRAAIVIDQLHPTVVPAPRGWSLLVIFLLVFGMSMSIAVR